jgi:hypothetical protein
MILSDREVRAAKRGGVIGVTSCPADSEKRWTSTTLDLTLAEEQQLAGGLCPRIVFFVTD